MKDEEMQTRIKIFDGNTNEVNIFLSKIDSDNIIDVKISTHSATGKNGLGSYISESTTVMAIYKGKKVRTYSSGQIIDDEFD